MSDPDDHRPREHDHLVEPLYGGLASGEEPTPDSERGTERVEVRRTRITFAWFRAVLRTFRPDEPEEPDGR